MRASHSRAGSTPVTSASARTVCGTSREALGRPRYGTGVRKGASVSTSSWSSGVSAAASRSEPALPRVRAIGETGLDRFRTGPEGWAAQEAAFRAQIRIAKDREVALVIHDRDAHDEILRVLEDEGAPEHTVFHCFSGDAAFAKACVERGYELSFAGTQTFGNAGDLREAAARTPVDQLLVETDAPFLTPVPHRGRPNASRLVPHTVRALAEVAGVELDELCVALTANAERVFGPWNDGVTPA